MNKTCGRCKEEKPLTEFRKRGNGHQAWCTPCFRQYDKNRYADLDKNRKSSNQRKIRERQRNLIKSIKKLYGCVDCRNKDHRVLDFDHVRDTKYMDVSKMVGSYSDQRIIDEIAKCEVRCANCHRIKTYERRERGRR